MRGDTEIPAHHTSHIHLPGNAPVCRHVILDLEIDACFSASMSDGFGVCVAKKSGEGELWLSANQSLRIHERPPQL